MEGNTFAGMIESQESSFTGLTGEERAAQMERLEALCSHALVQKQLQELGLPPEEVKTRLARLSDSELRELSRRIDQVLPGAQDDYSERPLYKRVGFYVLWVLVIVLIIVTFIGIGNNVF
jgi:hypothetical protein